MIAIVLHLHVFIYVRSLLQVRRSCFYSLKASPFAASAALRMGIELFPRP